VTGNTPASFGNVLVTNTSSIDLPPPLLDEERLEMEMDEDADVDDSNSEPLQSSITSPTVAKASAASTVTLAASVRLSVPMGTTLPKKKAKNERTPEEKRESNAKRKARSQELAQALEALYDVLIKDCERIGKQFDETPEDILSRLCLTYENKHSRAPTAWNGFLKWKAQSKYLFDIPATQH
jgi:hypothetical protein